MIKTPLSVLALTERHLVKNLLGFLASLLVAVSVLVSSAFAVDARVYTGTSFGPEGPGRSADFKSPSSGRC